MADSLEIRVLLFAGLRERAGQERIQVVLPLGSSVRDLRTVLTERHRFLGELPYRVARNQEFVLDESERLERGDEVALLPPVSGG